MTEAFVPSAKEMSGMTAILIYSTHKKVCASGLRIVDNRNHLFFSDLRRPNVVNMDRALHDGHAMSCLFGLSTPLSIIRHHGYRQYKLL
jgi:sugar lactone lactonase YvrE